ncbi:hypothetical protein I6E74_02610 [Salinibacterium sp. SWN139]|uniref:hypothetical protein n=1 Tax=Salinibacterium sp. SWN139 TaxID=2792055 RepID=UPI0018CF3229|nr:hypothetical protein [Salinibacterium sp. SWN139]MBH0053060.1 hypothetical protein [Salinibacterium sp. SWN139]
MSITPEHDPAASAPQQPAMKTTVEAGSVSIRRVPKYGAFMTVGGGVGAIVTFILTMSFPVDGSVGFGALFGYFSLFGIPAGVALGAVLALILDRVSSRRAKTATAEHETVEPEAYEGTLE